MERERKFLVDRLPDDLGPAVAIRQGYLALDGNVQVRVRRADTVHLRSPSSAPVRCELR